MRTFSVALATALLLWAGTLLKAQHLQQSVLPEFSRTNAVATTDSTHTQKTAYKKISFLNVSTSLGHPAGKKLAGPSKRETDSLQQVILLRKKF